MRPVARWLALPARDRRLLARALSTSLWARLALQVQSIDRLRAWAARRGAGTDDVTRIVWAVRAAARYTPRATCLSNALALQRLLAANGHAAELHIGVTREAGAFAAHAWVERDGAVLIGEEEQRRYTRLVAWTAGAETGSPSPGSAGRS